MECPICKRTMQEGCIPADRTALKWHGGTIVRLTKSPVMGIESAPAFYCPDCRHIIVPVPEIESFSEKVQKKIDSVTKNIQIAAEKFDRQRNEKQEQKNKKRKGKDPWEM